MTDSIALLGYLRSENAQNWKEVFSVSACVPMETRLLLYSPESTALRPTLACPSKPKR
jgi:hypothetical protein